MDEIEQTVTEQFSALTTLIDTVVAFLVQYSFQILGAVIVLLIGLKLANWLARRTVAYGERREFDPTLTKFFGNVVRLLVLVVVIIVTLNNFGITIAPLIALAGAGAFGATLALQGPLSNYGAGLSIILTRPFKVGDTVQIQDAYGVCEDIALSHTTLRGEDGERIMVPNKEIVGQIIVNSDDYRIVEQRILIPNDADSEKAIAACKRAIEAGIEKDSPAPQVGVEGFAPGALAIGLRYWVPSLKYFRLRYQINAAIVAELRRNEVPLIQPSDALFARMIEE